MYKAPHFISLEEFRIVFYDQLLAIPKYFYYIKYISIIY